MERKIFKMYELSGSDACTERREFDFILTDKESEYYKKSVAAKKIIRDYMAGDIGLDDLPDAIKEAMENIPYYSREQKTVQMMDTLKQVYRFCSCITREGIVLIPAFPEDVPVSDEMAITVSPDFYRIIGGDELEMIKIRCSKPQIRQAAADTDLGLYAMLVYAQAKALTMPGIKYVKASYYFLGRKDDTYSTDNPYFEPDFFKTAKGENIVSLADDISLSWTKAAFAPIADNFMAGQSKEECSKEDCLRCILNYACNYAEAPLAFPKEKASKGLADFLPTPAQQKAIDYMKGICRINAGAGAGKTQVVAIRTANLLDSGVKEKEICLVTFTNAGAKEMRDRIYGVLEANGVEKEYDVNKICIQTFNAFGDAIIKRDYKKIGFTEPPTLIDDTERNIIIARLLNEAVLEERFDKAGNKIPNPLKKLNWRNFTANERYVKGAIIVTKAVFDIMKANRYTPADLPDISKKLGSYSRFIKKGKEGSEILYEIAMLYQKYDDILHEENLIEYADQQALVFDLLHLDPFYFERFGFRHIIVDEFQDSDENQIKMIKLLTDCPTFESLMVVGDDSQSIYAFRGTTNEFILNFAAHIGCEIDDIFLLENHRSTPEIIDFANKINANNEHRVIKDLVATRPHGKPVVVQGFISKAEEQQFVIDSIKEHMANGTKCEDIAIECFTRNELMKMADLLSKENIPCIMLNPEPLIENSRVQGVIALINALQNPADTKDMFIYANAVMHGGLMKKSGEEIGAIIENTRDAIGKFYSFEKEDERKAYLLRMMIDLDHLGVNKDKDGNEIYNDEVYKSFIDKITPKQLAKMLEYVGEFVTYGAASAVKREAGYPGVVLTTAHSSKGLEWPIVYNMISHYHKEAFGSAEAEERRRLFFVSSTRARDELYVTAQYIAYGSKKAGYMPNMYLKEAYAALGNSFDMGTVLLQKEMLANMAKAEKDKIKEEKRKLKANYVPKIDTEKEGRKKEIA